MPSTVKRDGDQLENTEGGFQKRSTLPVQYSKDASKSGVDGGGVVKRTRAAELSGALAILLGMPIAAEVGVAVALLDGTELCETLEPTIPARPLSWCG